MKGGSRRGGGRGSRSSTAGERRTVSTRFFGGVTLMVVPPLRAQEKQLSFLQRRRTASALSRDPRAPPGARPRSRACRRLRGTPSTLDKVRDSSERRARRASRRPLCGGARARAPAVLGTFPCSSVRNATAARGGQAGSITAPAAHFAIGSREFLAASERPFTRRAPRDSPRHSARALRGAGAYPNPSRRPARLRRTWATREVRALSSLAPVPAFRISGCRAVESSTGVRPRPDDAPPPPAPLRSHRVRRSQTTSR